jgi:predicted SAM-dependent methyltransferase
MPDFRRMIKRAALVLRQFLRRADIVERHVRGHGIEIGALQDPQWLPAAAKARYVDAAPTAELRRKYPRKATRHLVQVDVVDDGERLASLATDSQDFVVANHFLEHCEDVVLTVSNLLRVVRPGGVVYLSVPDKRFTFDRDRSPTTVEHVLADHRDGPAISRRSHYEEVVRCAEHVQGATAVAARVDELMVQDYRIHFHSWDQVGFLELLVALQRTAGIAFDVLEFVQNEHEFVAVLRKPAAVSG